MESQQPLGQPINPNPTDPQFVPQPFEPNTPKPKMNKKRWWIIGGIVGLLLLLGAGYWFTAKSANESYKKDATTYEQAIKEVRDGMNAALDSQDVGPRDPEAPPIFEEYGQKLQKVVEGAPKQPKVLFVMPVTIDDNAKEEVAALSKAAGSYAAALRIEYANYSYYGAVTAAFKPIKDLGTITALDEQKLRDMATFWKEYTAKFRELQPPVGLEGLKPELEAQNKEVQDTVDNIVANYDTNSIGQTDQLVSALKPLTTKVNKTFVDAIIKASNSTFETINTTYDELDKLLQ